MMEIFEVEEKKEQDRHQKTTSTKSENSAPRWGSPRSFPEASSTLSPMLVAISNNKRKSPPSNLSVLFHTQRPTPPPTQSPLWPNSQTQEPSLSQEDSTAGGTEEKQHRFGFLEDVYAPTNAARIPVRKREFAIGRAVSNDLVLDNLCVSREHCRLHFAENDDRSCTLIAINHPCWVNFENRWQKVEPNTRRTLVADQRFRLVHSGRDDEAKKPGLEYLFYLPAVVVPPSSTSFDDRYLSLLNAINRYGIFQRNSKGDNTTLRKSFDLSISLRDCNDRNILPLTTLRDTSKGRGALIEAIWYLRGEDHIRFLKENKCHFWDKQCGGDGWIGLNYGLLTNFPANDGGSLNQLKRVLSKLCNGETSRNMTCSLLKPDEPTAQVACTSSIQFSVSTNENEEEELDLTVTQRSSDVIVGLPHDVVAWSIILHLVRREVRMRSERKLLAGNLIFSINAGGAHVYNVNSQAFHELLTRQPVQGVHPFFQIRDEAQEKSIFSLSKDFNIKDFTICGYHASHPAIKVNQAV
jgi:thymidylate synthase